MNVVMLGIYPEFSCIADKCTASCCTGWKIVVDDKAYMKFESLADDKLRDDIMSNIICHDSEYTFKNRSDGRCSMLDDDGLCRIQRNTDEETLCNTCRKYPRLTSVVGDELWISMAASCPVIAEYLLGDDVCLCYVDEHKNISRLKDDYISIISAELPLLSVDDLNTSKIMKARRYFEQYNGFIDLVDEIVEVILEYPECGYLEGCFDCYEVMTGSDAIYENMTKFHEHTDAKWNKFRDNYIRYRIFSRYLENSDESVDERRSQIFGELALIRTITYSRYVSGILQHDSDWVAIIHWVYKLCAHGRNINCKVHKIFTDLFHSDDNCDNLIC